MSLHNTVTLGANERQEFFDTGLFFRLLAATATLDVEFYRQGRMVVDAVGVSAGYAERFAAPGFDRFVIANGATAQTLTFASRDSSEVQFDAPPVGNVAVTNSNGGSFTHTQATVTTTAANAVGVWSGRRYMLIQNKSQTGTVWVHLNGTATQANGVRLGPGESLEMAGFCSIGAVSCIGDIASNPEVVVVQGG